MLWHWNTIFVYFVYDLYERLDKTSSEKERKTSMQDEYIVYIRPIKWWYDIERRKGTEKIHWSCHEVKAKNIVSQWKLQLQIDYNKNNDNKYLLNWEQTKAACRLVKCGSYDKRFLWVILKLYIDGFG